MTAVAFGPTLALRRGYFYSKEPRNQGNNIPKFSDLKGTECGVAIPDSLDQEITRSYSKEPRNQGNIIPKFPDSLDNKIARSF